MLKGVFVYSQLSIYVQGEIQAKYDEVVFKVIKTSKLLKLSEHERFGHYNTSTRIPFTVYHLPYTIYVSVDDLFVFLVLSLIYM